MLQELTGQHHFLGNALRREQIYVLELVLAFAKVRHLHKTLVDEGIETVIQATHAHAENFGQFTLGQIRVGLQDTHDPEIGVFLDLGLAAGHGFGVVAVVGVTVKWPYCVLSTLPPFRLDLTPIFWTPLN
jgi:hypothetical protein